MLRPQGEDVVTTDGPFAETKEHLGGLTVIDVHDLDAALAWGERLARATTLAVEVRRQDPRGGHPVPRAAEEDLLDRLPPVLAVVYLIFNEGYIATSADQLDRVVLRAEAVRLGQLLLALLPHEPEVWGLLALMLLTQAWWPAQTDGPGAPVALAEQDRSC